MKMAELERRSGVGRETIRYYIREGLLPEPERRARNVAVYGDLHATRLKTIKRLQEERFLPLDVIKRVLDGDPSALPPAGDPFAQLGPLLAQRLGVGDGEPPVLLSALTGDDAQAVRDAAALEAAGTISVFEISGGRAVSRLDARIVQLWRELRAAGYTAENFPAENSINYVEVIRSLAVTEVARFFDGFAGRIGQADATEKAQAGVEIVNAIIATLRIRFILDEVAKRSAELRRRTPA
ncbi:MAG: MerR family transcriptional regulator [Micropepsaceae bacterium]